MSTRLMRRDLIGVIVSMLMLAGCGGGNSPNDTSNGSVGTTSGIGPAGGTVNGYYGAQVTIPAGALSTNVDIAITRDSTNEPDLPSSGIDTAGAPYALTPHGTSFAQAATVRVPFDIDRIPTDATPVLYKAEPGGAFASIPTTVSNNMLEANVTNLSWVIPAYASTRPRVVYALTSNNGTLGVSSFKITKATGVLSAATGTGPTGDRPISVTMHPSRRFAFVTNAGTSTVNGIAPNSISVYQLDPVTGVISGPTDTKQVNGNPVFAVVHPTGKFVYVVNEVRFGSPVGNISVFAVDATTGALSGPTTNADSGGAPATAMALSPSGEFAYVTYMHATSTPVSNTYWDTVQTYSVDHTTGQLSGPIGSANTGDSPWAIAVTPGGHFAYVASLSTQNGVNELSTYSISSGIMYLQSSTSVQSQPSSLAMDPEGRFLYVGKQQPYYNQNLVVYSINGSSGALSATSAVLLGGGSQVGPIAVVAEPQGEFVYAIDSTNGDIVPYKLNAGSGTLTAGAPVGGVYAGGATGGVGDPFTFAASGTSPVWEDACTQMIEYYIQQTGGFVPTGGCFLPVLSSTADGSGGNATTPPPSAATTHYLNVSAGVWVNGIVSTPAGIDYGAKVVAGFPTGTSVTLCETPDPSQAFDATWTGTGGCAGTGTCTTVQMDHDQSCHVELTPVSTR